MRSPKFILLVFTAILFLGIGIITFFFLRPATPNVTQNVISDFKAPTPLPTYFSTITKSADTTTWKTYEDTQLKFSFQHPAEVVIDPRQTVKGRRTVFVFEQDLEKQLPNNVPSLFVADTGNKEYDGLTVYKYADCEKPCPVDTKGATWVKINETAYGIKNPNKKDILNYFITDKNQKGSVINIYVGNIKDTKDEKVQEKVNKFEEIISTIVFSR